MNKKLIIGIIFLVIVAVGSGIYFSNNSKREMSLGDTAKGGEGSTLDQEKDKEAMKQSESEETTMKTDVMAKKEDTSMPNGAGSYETYSPEKIAKAATGNVVLFFRASWCPTCRALDADIKAHLKDIPSALTILDVDYDNSTSLKEKYGVTYQHTFVQVDANGSLIKKWSGSPTLASLVSQVK